jgi:hypothetical protein
VYTSTLLVALSGLMPSAESTASPSWVTDYAAAREQCAKEHKPLVVVLGSGKAGWKKLGREGISPEARTVLADQYICVHVNTATSEGRQLAKEFGMPNGLGIVISDRTGELQAFRHEGDLTEEKLARYLTKYSDPEYVVQVTMTNPGKRKGKRGGYAGGGYAGCGGGDCGSCGGSSVSCGSCGGDSCGVSSGCGGGGCGRRHGHARGGRCGRGRCR